MNNLQIENFFRTQDLEYILNVLIQRFLWQRTIIKKQLNAYQLLIFP